MDFLRKTENFVSRRHCSAVWVLPVRLPTTTPPVLYLIGTAGQGKELNIAPASLVTMTRSAGA